MDAILPFFISGQRAPWDSPAGGTCLRRLLERIAACPAVGRVHVVTDDAGRQAFAESLQPLARVTVVSPPDLPDPSDARPFAAALSAARALTRAGIDTTPTVWLLNIRNPALTPDVLASARTRYEQAGQKPLVSIVCPENNPCQFLMPYAITAVGHILFFETPERVPAALAGFDPAAHVVSQPFVSPLGALSQDSRPFYCRMPADAFAPLGTDLTLPEAIRLTGPEPVWIQMDGYTARLACPIEVVRQVWGLAGETGLIGANLLRRPGDMVARVVRDSRPEYWRVNVRADPPLASDAVLTVLPLGKKDSTPRELPPQQAANGEAPFWLIEADPAYQGLLASLRVPARGEGVDLVLPYAPNPDLWFFAPERQACINVATGEPIMGRQTFPTVHELEGSLVLARLEDLHRLDAPGPDLSGLEFFALESAAFTDDRLLFASCPRLEDRCDETR